MSWLPWTGVALIVAASIAFAVIDGWTKVGNYPGRSLIVSATLVLTLAVGIWLLVWGLST